MTPAAAMRDTVFISFLRLPIQTAVDISSAANRTAEDELAAEPIVFDSKSSFGRNVERGDLGKFTTVAESEFLNFA